MRGAGDQRHSPGLDHAQADLADPSVSAALRDRRALLEAELSRGLRREPVNRTTEIEYLGRQLLEDIVEADLLVEGNRPAAVVTVVVAANRSGVDIGGHSPGQPKCRPIWGVDEVLGLPVGLRFALLEPEQL